MKKLKFLCASLAMASFASASSAANKPIIHDAEHYVLLEQHGDEWQKEDKNIDAKLADLKKKNGGMRPNIIYILIDDIGFGEFGIPELNDVRGYSTPNINKFAGQGISLTRMYTEPSCTPTRAAFLTGRMPTRSHMLEAKIVPPEGTGLNADEVTVAEILSAAGYNTAHVGKWHQGDIEQAYPHNQGFDTASFPMHNQATFNLMQGGSDENGFSHSVTIDSFNTKYMLDKNFRPKDWVLGVDAKKGEQAKEWGVKPGENLTYDYYYKLNDYHQQVAMSRLQELAAKDKPFFLNYWPQYPVDFSRTGKEFNSPNGGSWVERMQQLDGWIGDLLNEVERLGIAENTVIAIMSDNGTMKQALGSSGFTDMVYRGYKGYTTEGGVRVNAFVRWPQAIEADSMAGDMMHVSDLYTTFAKIAGATKYIPRDRVIDGVDQTSLLINGDSHGRRDYVHIYNGPKLAATVKENFKVHWPAPGEASFKLPLYNLYRDPREEKPLLTQGMWTVGYFTAMLERHKAFKMKYPDRPETQGMPYQGISNLRPETKAMLSGYLGSRRLLLK